MRLLSSSLTMPSWRSCQLARRRCAAPSILCTLNYTLGKLMILKLREDYQRVKGDGYSLKRFHDEFLSYGAPQIPLVREMMLGEDSGDIL